MFGYHFCIILFTSYFISSMHAFPIKSGSQAEDDAYDLESRIGAWEPEPASDPVRSHHDIRRVRFDSPSTKHSVASSEKQEDVLASENSKRPNKQNVNCYNCNLLNSHMA